MVPSMSSTTDDGERELGVVKDFIRSKDTDEPVIERNV